MYISTIFNAITLCLVYVSTLKGAVSKYTNTWAIQTDSEESARRIAKKYNFDYAGKIGTLDGYFLLVKKSVPRRRTRSTLYEGRILDMDPSVKWSQQQKVLKRVKRRFKDNLYKEQWHLENNATKGNDVNVVPVWKRGITGRNVVVTILDDGIEYTHPDLRKNYDAKASYDYNDRDDDPAPRYTQRNVNRHGTRCAGEVAAAANNGVCGVGVAYNAKIGGIRMLDGDVTDAVEGSSLSHERDYIDIYSSSWGPEDKGMKVDGPGKFAKDALKNGVKKGRNGKGSIFVWATGNGGDYNDHCNCDGYITSIYTISIGAVNDHGKSPWYAESCPSTLAVTYSSGKKGDNVNKKIATTDLHKSCTTAHTGTSAAAPLAAGIFALVLEANPDLTWRDLQHLIVETSRVTDGKDSEWRVNGAGFHVNSKYGFGLLDTDALVKRAQHPEWKTAPEQHTYRSGEKVDRRKLPGKRIFRSAINTGGRVNTRDCVTQLEHVVVYISLQHERRGTLEISLIAPSGTKSKLLGLRKNDMSSRGFKKWPFMTVFHWGENPCGTWTLEVKNTEDFPGAFEKWELRLYGTCSHVRNNTLQERDICAKHCKKGCPEKFSEVCMNCLRLCDCTTGRCTRRCARGLETDRARNECTNSTIKRGGLETDRTRNECTSSKINPGTLRPQDKVHPKGSLTAQKKETFPKYGLWLLIAAGIAVTFGVIAGIWQGWLYYRTRQKLNRARKQNQILRYPVVPRNTIVEHMAHAPLPSSRTTA